VHGFAEVMDKNRYSDIAVRFVDIASGFLAKVQSRKGVSPVKRETASLKPKDFAY
jgi:hypothetical protein